MESQRVITYLEEVGNWVQEIQFILTKNELDGHEVFHKFQAFSHKLEDLINNENITKDCIKWIMSEVGQLYEEIQLTIDDRTCRAKISRRVPIGEHQLPKLPYAYNALEPHISEEIMKLHHDTHHKSYVDGLNKAEKMMEKARQTNDYELLKHWEREAAFHGSGHYLHSIFWFIMKPNGGGKPSGALSKQINMDFGGFDNFKKHFSEAANKVEGVGWAILVWSPRSHRLEILQTEKHQLMTQWDTIPLLVLDVWEHAYYLQYKTDRAKYVNNWWNVVNWDEVEERFKEASKVQWTSF